MFERLQRGDMESAKRLLADERRSFGWDFLRGDEGNAAEASFWSFAEFMDRYQANTVFRHKGSLLRIRRADLSLFGRVPRQRRGDDSVPQHHKRALVCGGLLDVIDDENFNRTFSRLKSQPELIL